MTCGGDVVKIVIYVGWLYDCMQLSRTRTELFPLILTTDLSPSKTRSRMTCDCVCVKIVYVGICTLTDVAKFPSTARLELAIFSLGG